MIDVVIICIQLSHKELLGEQYSLCSAYHIQSSLAL